MSRLLTTREVADRLGLSVETVLRWAKRGKLPAVYLSSRAVRFNEHDIDVWLEQRATPRREELSRTPQSAARWQLTAPRDTLGPVTHPEGEED